MTDRVTFFYYRCSWTLCLKPSSFV